MKGFDDPATREECSSHATSPHASLAEFKKMLRAAPTCTPTALKGARSSRRHHEGNPREDHSIFSIAPAW